MSVSDGRFRLKFGRQSGVAVAGPPQLCVRRYGCGLTGYSQKYFCTNSTTSPKKK